MCNTKVRVMIGLRGEIGVAEWMERIGLWVAYGNPEA